MSLRMLKFMRFKGETGLARKMGAGSLSFHEYFPKGLVIR